MSPLQKNMVTISFGHGVDTKTAEKLVSPGDLLLLQDAVFRKGGSLNKRNGYKALSTNVNDGSTINTGDALAIFNNELLLHGNQNMYSWSEAINAWVNKGASVSCLLTNQQIFANNYQQRQPDKAVLNNISLYAWEDTRGGVWASVFDESTGLPIINGVQLNTTAIAPRCLALGGYLFVFYTTSGNLIVRRLNPVTANAFDNEVTLTSTVNTSNPTFDVTMLNNTMVFVQNTNNSGSTIGIVSSVPSLLQSVNFPEASTNAASINVGDNSQIFTFYHNNTNGLRGLILTNTLGTGSVTGSFTVDPIYTPVVNITSVALSSGSGAQVYYEVAATASYNHFVKSQTVSNGGLTGSVSGNVFMRGHGLSTKAFVYQTPSMSIASRSYVGVAYDSPIQPTNFLVRNDGVIAAKIQSQQAGGLTIRPSLPNVIKLEQGEYTCAVLYKGQTKTINGVAYTQTAITSETMNFQALPAYTSQQIGNNLIIGGGIVQMYDGAAITELNFNEFPEFVSASVTASGGNIGYLLSGAFSGSYQVAAVYEWTDNYGQVHRSIPSVPQSFITSGTTNSVNYTVPTLRNTTKNNVRISLYRTQANLGNSFYKITNDLNPLFNNTQIDTVSYLDTGSDTAIASNQLLYTEGLANQELESTPPPAASNVIVYQNRIILGGLEDANTLWYSKIRQQGAPVEFNAGLTIQLDPLGGPITAIGVLDANLVIFKKDRMHYTQGDGLTNTGTGTDFPIPIIITTDVGCVDANSLSRAPEMILFKSAKGIYALGSSLSVSYIGAGVEDFNNLTVSSAVLKPDVNEVRFTTFDGSTLVYNYYYGQWSTFTNHLANDALTRLDDTFVYLRPNGQVYVETPGYFFDNTQTISFLVQTSWLTPNNFQNFTVAPNLQGYFTVYKSMFLGNWQSDHILVENIEYDYNEGPKEVIIFNATPNLQIDLYGTDPTYGQSVAYGGQTGLYQYIHHHGANKKCQSVRFTFYDVINSATSGSGEGYGITGLSLEVGQKVGLYKKLPGSQRT